MMSQKKKNVTFLKTFFERHRVVVGIVAAVFALGVATVYFFVVPEEASRATGVVGFVLQYAHSACWLLLATASALWATGRSATLTTTLCYAALITYGLFLAALFFTKFTS